MITRFAISGVTFLIALILSALVTGCGGPGANMTNPGSAEVRAHTAEIRTQLLSYVKCMREHGINLPDPEMAGNGVAIKLGLSGSVDSDSAEFRSADLSCGSLMPHNSNNPPSRKQP